MQFCVYSFNTQPPEGGCLVFPGSLLHVLCFNTQPPEGGCTRHPALAVYLHEFQHTAARRRLLPHPLSSRSICESFNTQPPEGGCHLISDTASMMSLFQHTAARRRLQTSMTITGGIPGFQHTAARRRLLRAFRAIIIFETVSTHSRPKAAA